MLKYYELEEIANGIVFLDEIHNLVWQYKSKGEYESRISCLILSFSDPIIFKTK
jgi:hypothetical protein